MTYKDSMEKGKGATYLIEDAFNDIYDVNTEHNTASEMALAVLIHHNKRIMSILREISDKIK